MSGRALVWTPSIQAHTSGDDNGFRIRIVIDSAEGMPDTVFRYLKRLPQPTNGDTILRFDGVCSPADLEEFPESEPDPTRLPAFCRLSYVDLLFRSQAVAMEAKDLIEEELRRLVILLDNSDDLIDLPQVAYGDIGESSSLG